MRYWSTLVIFVILLATFVPRSSAMQNHGIAQEDGWSMIIDSEEFEYIRKVIEEEQGGFAILGRNHIIQAEPTINYSNVVEYPFSCKDFVENRHETGGYAIAGSYDDKIIWVDTYASGNPRGNRTYSFVGYENAAAFLIDQCDDQGYIIYGGITNSATESLERIILRIDDEGNELWHNIIPWWYDGVSIDSDMIRCSTGGFLGAGKNRSAFLTQLVRIDDSGNKLWNSPLYKVDNYMGSTDIIECNNGEYAFSTSAYGFDPAISSREYFLVDLYYDNGTQKWSRVYDPPYYASWSSSIIEMRSGGFVIGGISVTHTSISEFFLFRIDANGNTMWHREIGEPYVALSESNVHLIPYSLGGIVLAGLVETSPTVSDILLKWVPDESPPSSNTTTSLTETTNTDLEGDLANLQYLMVGLIGVAVLVIVVVFVKRRSN